MPRRPLLALLLALALLGAPAGPGHADEPAGEGADEGGEAAPALAYRTAAEVAAALEELETTARAADRNARRLVYGQSAGGRDLVALEVGAGPASVLVHGGLGPRDAAATVACLELARRVAAGEGGDLAWLLVPAPNPDALDAFLAGGRAWGGPDVDRDGDGRRGEDGPADVDGDGLILWMRRPAADGTWAPLEGGEALADVPPEARPLVEAGVDARREVSYELRREAGDADGDGRVGEDAPGLDLRRGLCGWWDEVGPWGGAGPFPGFAPEARALMDLSHARKGLVAWYGFTGVGEHVLRASEHGEVAKADDALYERIGEALAAAGAPPIERARAVGAGRNPGSDLDWACVHLGVPAFRVPVWTAPPTVPAPDGAEEPAGEEPVEGEAAWLAWAAGRPGPAAFVPWRAFDHPVLGRVEIGGWRPYTRHEPPPEHLGAAARKAAALPLAHVDLRPRLDARLEVEDVGGGIRRVALRALNRGEVATASAVAEARGLAWPVIARLAPAEGVDVLAGPRVARLGTIAAGGASETVTWLLRAPPDAGLGRLRLTHPAAGDLELPLEAR